MFRNKREITLEPIGLIKTLATEEDFKTHRRDIVSEIVLDRKYVKGLKGIGQYSHLFVIYWLHEVSEAERRELLTHPKHREELPKVGIFSTRHRNHPNPIGLTVVELVKVESNILKVKGLDAINGTPVLDIKPYDYYDMPEKIKVPEWWLSFR